MHLGNQRACCIEYLEISIRRLLLNLSRYPVRTENDDRFVWYLTQLIHKYRTSRTELVDHTTIVDYFVPNIDRWAIARYRCLDDLNCTIHTGTKTPWTGQ